MDNSTNLATGTGWKGRKIHESRILWIDPRLAGKGKHYSYVSYKDMELEENGYHPLTMDITLMLKAW